MARCSTLSSNVGIPIGRAREVYAEAARLPGIAVVGVDVHIGSQLTELAPYEAAFGKVAELTERLRADGHVISRLDLGGGLVAAPHTRLLTRRLSQVARVVRGGRRRRRRVQRGHPEHHTPPAGTCL